MSRALYRKYRSKSLDEIVGQDHITNILARAIKAGRVSHAYLLTGPKGVGKTSVARILAHEINGLAYDEEATHLDIIEIDAASNNGVEDIRDLRDKVQIAPVSAAKKVYIIDEVHMLSKAAFNALLKTLEEPPEHVVFILATTDIDKLPATIISRTQRFGFRAIGSDDAIKQLRFIADSEKIVVTDDALKIIAERGDGSFRDSISLLDQLSSLTDDKEGITPALVEGVLGLAPDELIQSILSAVDNHDIAEIVTLIDGASAQGISASIISGQLTRAIRVLAAEKPQLLSLLDTLLDVPRSNQPDLKLLSVLGTAAIAKQPSKTAALIAPALEISATIEELSRQATMDNPDLHSSSLQATSQKTRHSDQLPSASQHTELRQDTTNVASLSSAELAALKQSSKSKEASLSASGARDSISSADSEELQRIQEETGQSRSDALGVKPLQPEFVEAPGPSPEPGAKPFHEESNRKGESINGAVESNDFDWDSLIEYTRKNHVALYSVLSKCAYDATEKTLTLYAQNSFYKKKLDDPKYSALLYKVMQETSSYQPTIHIVATPPPPTDSQAAAVAAIMGGGEEVSVEA